MLAGYFPTNFYRRDTRSLDHNKKNRAPSEIPKCLVCSGVYTFTSIPFSTDFNNDDDKCDNNH